MHPIETIASPSKIPPHLRQPVRAELQAVYALLKRDHARGLAALKALFRNGELPQPALNGRYAGELLALDIAPGLTQLFQLLANSCMPWLGKSFDAARQQSDNLFSQDSRLLARLFNPFYRGFTTDKAGIHRAFPFHTYADTGLADPEGWRSRSTMN